MLYFIRHFKTFRNVTPLFSKQHFDIYNRKPYTVYCNYTHIHIVIFKETSVELVPFKF